MWVPKRSVNLYLVAKGITKDEQKTALLLHTGGLNFQELYYTLLTGTLRWGVLHEGQIQRIVIVKLILFLKQEDP